MAPRRLTDRPTSLTPAGVRAHVWTGQGSACAWAADNPDSTRRAKSRACYSRELRTMTQDNPTRLESDGVEIELWVGDIAAQEGFDAVVNAANAELRSGGGVAGALHRAAGPGLAEEARPLAPIRPGQAVLTLGHALPNPWVIHCLGPVYGRDHPEDELLASCYREALRIAEERGLESIAFPAISTGAFGYPVRDAAQVALRTILAAAPGLRSVQRVRFVLHDDEALRVYRAALAEQVRGRIVGSADPSTS